MFNLRIWASCLIWDTQNEKGNGINMKDNTKKKMKRHQSILE